MVKAILGFDIMPGITVEEYEEWVRDFHMQDLFRIPGLKKIVRNRVKGIVKGSTTFYRIAELHYDSMKAFERARKWQEENLMLEEGTPEDRIDLKFHVICETEEFEIEK